MQMAFRNSLLDGFAHDCAHAKGFQMIVPMPMALLTAFLMVFDCSAKANGLSMAVPMPLKLMAFPPFPMAFPMTIHAHADVSKVTSSDTEAIRPVKAEKE